MTALRAAFELAGLELLARRRRILILLAAAGLFLAVAATAAAIGREHGHVELDTLFQVGGYPLISAVLLIGWLLGRFPVLATLVLMSGVIAGDVVEGRARLVGARPVSPRLVYGVRVLVLAALAFLLSAALMPLFDLIMIGEWAGPALFVLVLAHVAVWSALTALLSLATRLDAWVALLLAVFAMVWGALRDVGLTPLPPPLARALGLVLPPQAEIFALESAFAGVASIPWGAFWFCMGYAAVALLVAGWLVGRRTA